MSGPIDIYYFPPSPPSRCVLLVSSALGIDVNKKLINMTTGEHKSAEYAKINPQCTLPVMDDNGFVLTESRAIIKYLVDKSEKHASWAPQEAKAGALMNQMLYFDAGTLTPRIAEYFRPVLFLGNAPNPDTAEKIHEALGFLNTYLENRSWAAGDNLTIADFALVVSVSTAEAVMIDISRHPNVFSWYEKCKAEMAGFGYQEINQNGADMIHNMFKSKTQQS